MIIQLRGTSGSGKSTAMRKLISLIRPFEQWKSERIDGRKNPLYYWTTYGSRIVNVLGHYESPCGGVDTIQGYDSLMSLVRDLTAKESSHVLMEGLLLSEDAKNTLALLPRDVRCIFLSTPLGICLERIRGRRAEKGNEKPLNVENTSRRVAVIERARVRLEAAGVRCRIVPSELAPNLAFQWLKEDARCKQNKSG